MTYGDLDVPEEFAWAMAEAHKEAIAVAPGWFRAWPTGDERWSALNIRAATQIIVNHSREDDRHPNAWTVRALFGDAVAELRVGPYDSKARAILVAHAILSLAFGPASPSPALTDRPSPAAPAPLSGPDGIDRPPRPSPS